MNKSSDGPPDRHVKPLSFYPEFPDFPFKTAPLVKPATELSTQSEQHDLREPFQPDARG
jgi:hypothetical protein